MQRSSGSGRGRFFASHVTPILALVPLLATTSCNPIFGIEPGELTGSGGTAATTNNGGTAGSGTGGTMSTGGTASTSSGGGPCAGSAAPDGHATGWVKRAIGGYSDIGRAIARQPAGGLIVTGTYTQDDFVVDLVKLPYPTHAEEPQEEENVFVARYKPDGKPDWAIGFAGRSRQRATSVVTDFTDNSIVSGYFLNAFQVGATTLSADDQLYEYATDGFVLKLDSRGVPQWAKQFGGPSIDQVVSAAADSMGNVLVLGVSVLGGEIDSAPATTTVDYGCGPRTLDKDVQRVFLTKLNKDGGCVWDKQLEIDTRFYGANNPPSGLAMTIDPDDNIVLAGGFSGTANFGGGISITSPGNKNIFVYKATPNGEPLWAESYGDGNSQAARAVAVDADGDIWIGGSCQLSITLDPLPIQADPLADGSFYSKGFVAKLELSGDPAVPAKPVFLQALWDKGWQEVKSVAVSSDGDAVLGGVLYAFEGSTGVDFGDGAKIPPSGPDAGNNYHEDGFVVKYCKDGGLRWAKRFGTSAIETVFGVTTDNQGNTFATGSFDGKYDFDGSQSYTPFSEDVFTLRLGP